jgi:hypothetical protein
MGLTLREYVIFFPDMCGKCGGDNSTCVSIKGSYNNSTYGYSRVVRIPAGSSNLDIRQYGHKGTTDDNYLGKTITLLWKFHIL